MASPKLDLLHTSLLDAQKKPFDAGPNADVFYNNFVYKSTVSALAANIDHDAGLSVLTGEVGTGKTLVIRRVIEGLDVDNQPVVFRNPRLTFAEFISFACQELDLSGSKQRANQKLQDKLKALKNYLAFKEKGSVIFFIDDAQDIAEDVLTELLALPKLQIVLVGLPELEALLHRPSLYELTANGLPPYKLTPLKPKEVGNFITQQLSAFNRQSDNLFSAEAIARIAFYSRGIPRLITMLCDSALFTANLNSAGRITADIVEEAAKICSLALVTDYEFADVPETEISAAQTSSASRQRDEGGHAKPLSAPAEEITKNLIANSLSEQENSMNRTESLNKVLKNLQSGSPDVEASALISEDGLMIASALPQDLDETRVAGMSATLLSLGSRAVAELRRGEIQEVIVRGEQGYAVMITAGRGVLLLVLTNENAKLGLVFFDMREAINALKRIL